MNGLPRGYDAWRLAGPDDDIEPLGVDEGETCNRYPEPDEDAPRGWKPRRCNGIMGDDQGYIYCDTCGETPE